MPAHAGTDVTFGTLTTGHLGFLTNLMTGSIGKLFSLFSLFIGLAIGIAKQSLMEVSIGVGFSMVASAGPAIINSIFSAII